ncbi:FAD-binding domain-containing protein [Xylaria digitata]|nr:FAD-binding domain-containing protein [Xylaria digitata]
MSIFIYPIRLMLVHYLFVLLCATPILGLLSEDLLEIVSNGPNRNTDEIQSLIEQIEKAADDINTAATHAIVARSSSAVARSSAACALSRLIFLGRVIASSSPNYISEQDVNWSSTCWLSAACFVRVNGPVEIAVTLRIITATQSKFSVRGGGHTPNPGFSSVDNGGILIDLQNIKTLSLGRDGVLQVGPGNNWKAVYDYVEGHGRAAKGARVQDVGVPGFLLGGGLVFFPSLHGLAVDSITSYELVLANSSIVYASRQQNIDLFLALKGGGTNFGVVTRFTITTYPAIPAQYSLTVYNASDYPNILNATIQVQKAMESDPNIDIFVSVAPAAVTVGLLYADWLPEPPQAFNTFFGLSSLLESPIALTNGSIGSFEAAMDKLGPPHAARRLPSTATTTYDLDFYIYHHERFLEIVRNYPSLSSANISYTIAPLASTAVREGIKRGGNSLGLDDVPQTWWSYPLEWAEAKDDFAAQQLSAELVSGVQSLANERGRLLKFHFMNHASYTQDVLDSYGKENLKRLRSAAESADPKRMFQNLQNDGFLLRKL